MPEAPDERDALEAAWQQHQDDGCDTPIMCFEAAWQARGEYEAGRVEALRAALEEIRACLGHLYSDHTYSIARLATELHKFAGPLSIIDRMTDQALAALAGPAPAPEEQRS